MTLPSITLDSAPKSAEKRRLIYIDLLRGFACLWVVMQHSAVAASNRGALTHSGPWSRLYDRFAGIGWLGVSLFLVLSGFCLFFPLVRKSPITEIRLDVKEFARRRATRILPAYYVVLVVLVIFYHLRRTPVATDDIALHLLMLHNLSPSTFDTINPVFWSLALECQLYLLFPLFVRVAARSGFRTLLCSTLVVSVGWQFAVYSRLGFSMAWTPLMGTWYYALPARCFEFALGMYAAWVVARSEAGVWARALSLMPLFALPAAFYVVDLSRFGPFVDQLWGCVFACAIVGLSGVPQARFNKYAPVRALAWVGVISYSIYLVHFPILFHITLNAPHFQAFSRYGSLPFAVLRFALILATGAALYLVAERPFLNRRKPAAGRAVRPDIPAATPDLPAAGPRLWMEQA